MIVCARVDSRLVHGQVIEAWLPVLKVARILVADDDAASHPLTSAAMAIAVPPPMLFEIRRLDEVDFAQEDRLDERTLLLLRDPESALRAFARGLRCPTLNLGNVHFEPGRERLTASVFLTPDEGARLATLAASGQAIEVRALPHERAEPLQSLLARLGHGAAAP